MIVNLLQRINGCVPCQLSKLHCRAGPQEFLCHAVGSGFRFLPICQTVLTFKASFIAGHQFLRQAIDSGAILFLTHIPMYHPALAIVPVAEMGINFCAPFRFLPIYQSIPTCYAVLTFKAFCRAGHKFLSWLRSQEPAPLSLCHPELAIEASFEVLAPQTSK